MMNARINSLVEDVLGPEVGAIIKIEREAMREHVAAEIEKMRLECAATLARQTIELNIEIEKLRTEISSLKVIDMSRAERRRAV